MMKKQKMAAGGLDERKARLAEQLRVNLQRRKQQARSRRTEAEGEQDQKNSLATGHDDERLP